MPCVALIPAPIPAPVKVRAKGFIWVIRLHLDPAAPNIPQATTLAGVYVSFSHCLNVLFCSGFSEFSLPSFSGGVNKLPIAGPSAIPETTNVPVFNPGWALKNALKLSFWATAIPATVTPAPHNAPTFAPLHQCPITSPTVTSFPW